MAVNTESRHEVLFWVKTQTAEGNLKNCMYLKVNPASVVMGKTVFLPKCDQRSFHWKQHPAVPKMELDILLHSLHTNPISCPKDCTNYLSRRKVNFFRRLSSLRPGAPFTWFAKLPWQTQFLLVALIILLVAPRWVPQLVNLFNAIHGK